MTARVVGVTHGQPIGEDTTSDAIFALVKQHINSHVAVDFDQACSDAGDIQAVTLPTANFSETTDVDLPDKATFDAPVIQSDGTVVATPIAPELALSPEDIAAGALDDIESTVYQGYELPLALPVVPTPLANLQYPQSGFLSVPESAGLDGNIEFPDIDVGASPEFLEIAQVLFEEQPLAPMPTVARDEVSMPELSLLPPPSEFDPAFDEKVLSALIRGVEGEEVIALDIQRITLDRGVREADRAAQNAERAAFTKAASQGHAAASGSLIHELSEISHDTTFSDREIHERLRSDVYRRGLAQLQESAKAAIRLEAQNGEIHINYAGKIVETLRVNVALQTEYANLLVRKFNAALSAVKTELTAYGVYIDALTTQRRALLRSIDAQQEVARTNEAKVRVFASQVGTVGAQADLFSLAVEYGTQEIQEYVLRLQGIDKNVTLAKLNIESYSHAIRAYAQDIDIDKAKLDAYASQVRATGSASGVYEANYDVYGAAHSADAQNQDAVGGWYSSSARAISAEVGLLSQARDAQQNYLQTLAAWDTATSSVHRQHERTTGAGADYTQAHNRHTLSLSEAQANVDLAKEDARVRMSALQAQTVATQAGIDLGLIAAQATIASGCSQAANSVKSISANMRATAGMSDNSTATTSESRSLSTQRSYAYNKRRSIST